MVPTSEQSLAQQRGEANFDNDFLVQVRQRQIRGESLTAEGERSLRMLLPPQLAEVDRVVEALQERQRQVEADIEEHGELAEKWYTWQGHGDLVAKVVPKKIRRSNGAARQRTSSRPQGGRPAPRSSSRSTRGSPDDDPSEPEPGDWPLDLVDRAPFLWRFRALRCRLLEVREGVDR